MAAEITTPHNNLFRSVFGDTGEASALLRAHLPPAISRQLRWSTLALQPVGFIDSRLRDSESDLLFLIRRKTDAAPVWLYVLLEHQSTPDEWLRLRLLKYSIRIWERDRRRHPHRKQLRPILPLVLYQGRRRWRHGREFSELFAQQVRHWPWVPHYAHLLVDQTRARPDQVRGELRGRIAQLAMMATLRRNWPLLQRLVPLLAELARVGTAAEDWEEIVVYIAATRTREPRRWQRFADAVRRRVPGGGELMNKTERMLQIYADVKEQEWRREGRKEGRRQGRREGRKEGELRGKVLTIKALLGRDVSWSTIQAATGIDQATFHRLKHRLEADGGSSSHPN